MEINSMEVCISGKLTNSERISLKFEEKQNQQQSQQIYISGISQLQPNHSSTSYTRKTYRCYRD